MVRNNSRTKNDETKARPLAYEFILGISEGLEEAGYMMSFVRLSDVEPEKHTQSSAFQDHLLDGLIVVNDVPATLPERLTQLVPHCVWLDGVWEPLNCMRRDERAAGELAGREIAGAGYREWIVLIQNYSMQPGQHYSFAPRLEGLRLAAILFPVFGRARENARRSSSQSNLKQIGLGLLQYAQDYDEALPRFTSQTNPKPAINRSAATDP